MTGKLQGEIKKAKPFDCLEQEAALNLHKTYDAFISAGQELFKESGLSSTQYNVLRILRGAGESLSCGEIAGRMITREPDMTRLLDRLEKRGLVSRCRQQTDRRVVKVKIMAKGLDLLATLDEPVLKMHRRQLGHLGPSKLKQLIGLLEEAREAQK
jgi:DNA-binding MarR family transcriptional regulator